VPHTEIITRRNLPHWYVPGAMHFVTYRLAGTVPAGMLEQLRERREALLRQAPPPGQSPGEHKARAHKLLFAAYDRCLDQNREIDWLAAPAVAAAIRENLHHHNGTKYHLLAYTVMPNHVHALLQPLEDLPIPEGASAIDDIVSDEQDDAVSPLGRVMHSLKSYTAHKINGILGRAGQLWQHESYDHWIRDEEELQRVVNYIAWNPVKAGLIAQPHEWLFSSAHDRFLQDGSQEWYLCGAKVYP
jgi:putative transposase